MSVLDFGCLFNEAGKQKNIIDIDLDVEPERVKAPAEKILEKLES